MSPAPLEIVHVFPSFALGGQQRRLLTLIDGLGADFRHRIISLSDDIAAADALNPELATAAAIPFRKASTLDFGNIRRLREAVAGADLLCTYNWGSIEAVIANRLGPRIRHIHHEDGFGADETGGRQLPRRVRARRILLSRSLVIVPSRTLEKIAIDIWKLKPDRVRRIPIGIDLEKFKVASRERSGALVTIAAIGALRPEKNFARLIRCFENASEGMTARLLIWGEGPERQTLQELAAISAAAPRITLAGETDEPERALAVADIFTLSSDTEQMPVSLIEAMATALPAVATDVGDVKSLVSWENEPFIVRAEDERRYATALKKLIEDAALRKKLGRANAEKSKAFDAHSMIATFGKLYGNPTTR
ncbi:MAG: glycosyltransferase [Parvularculaceae bacterium]